MVFVSLISIILSCCDADLHVEEHLIEGLLLTAPLIDTLNIPMIVEPLVGRRCVKC